VARHAQSGEERLAGLDIGVRLGDRAHRNSEDDEKNDRAGKRSMDVLMKQSTAWDSTLIRLAPS
jgi:hypothetical protein